MAITKTLANIFKDELGKGGVDFTDDEFRIILMDDTFEFDRESHERYSDISDKEISEENGYSQLDKTLTDDVSWTRDDSENKAYISWEDATWTADGGTIGPADAAVILRYDSSTEGESLIVGAIEFGESLSVDDGISLQIQDIGFDLVQGS